MNETKHTPGPWTISRYGRIGYDVIGGGQSIAIVGRAAQKRLEHCENVRSTASARGEPGHLAEQESQALEGTQGQIEADARLISAAPELLQALRMVMNVMPAEPPAAGRLIGAERRHYDAIMAAKKAIRKAEGRS